MVAKYLNRLSKNDYTITDTLFFPSLIKSIPLDSSVEDVSYDVESLFTSIPVEETIEFIVNEIYNNKVIQPFCEKKLIFKRLLERLTKDCVFSVNNILYKQIDGCPMGGSISVVMAGIFMVKLERDVLKPPLPIFYKRYVDDTYVRRKKDEPDILFDELNAYHQNINFTLERNPVKFLDTQFSYNNDEMITAVVSKDNKLPVHWSSKIPKRYKRNTINGELHRAEKIASNFTTELERIRLKFKKASYPKPFVESVITSFVNRGNNPQEENVPVREKVLINLPFCPENEVFAKYFLRRLDEFTNNKYFFLIIWKTRKIRSLFPLKDFVPNNYKSDIIYCGECSCGDIYIGESDRNAITRWSEHDNKVKVSEPSKHLKNNNDTHAFTWSILCSASRDRIKRKILESFFIKIRNPSLNNHLDNFPLILFRNGIT